MVRETKVTEPRETQVLSNDVYTEANLMALPHVSNPTAKALPVGDMYRSFEVSKFTQNKQH